ncbi:MAG: alpha/beta fold hydrolase [Thermoanaerobaculia bacterium]
MAAVPPPDLPLFIAAQLAFERRAWQLERGADAGRVLHYLEHGAAADRPVLLLHGNPTWSFLWRKVLAELAGLRAIAPDLLGLGFSDRLPAVGDHTVDRHADAVAELVETLDLDGVILVGQDWGGPIVTAVGARLPRRIAGLVLANTAVSLPSRPRGTAFHRFARAPLISDLVFRGLGFPQNVLHRAQADRASIRGDIARAYRWPLRRWSDRVAPLAMARMVPDSRGHPSFPALKRAEAWALGFDGPVALVWGVRDPILGRALRHQQRAFPGASVRRAEAGHFLQEEVPELVAEAIREVAAQAG